MKTVVNRTNVEITSIPARTPFICPRNFLDHDRVKCRFYESGECTEDEEHNVTKTSASETDGWGVVTDIPGSKDGHSKC